MCVVSMVMDHYWEKWKPLQPGQPQQPGFLPTMPPDPIQPWQSPISQEEINEFRKLLERAREYDKRNNKPDCEMEEKKQRLMKLAQELGVKIQFE